MGKLIGTAITLFVAYNLLSSFVDFYGTRLWFESLGYESTFWTIYTTEYLVGGVYWLAFITIVGINIGIATRVKNIYVAPGGGVYEQAALAFTKPAKMIFWVALLFVSYAMAAAPARSWMRVLQWIHGESFGQTDAAFGRDLGFYIFQLPFYQNMISWVFGVLIVTLIATALVYFYRRAITLSETGVQLAEPAKRHLYFIVALILFTYVGDYYYAAFDLLYSDNGIVVGAGYTDLHSRVIGYRILMGIAFLAGLGAIWAAVKLSLRTLVISILMPFAFGFILLTLVPGFVQRFVVSPNMLELEKPYIEENIRQTRFAYDLNKVEVSDFNYEINLTANDLRDNASTVKNITLWDYRPIKDSYSQLQEIRPYYNFIDVDIDRYMIDGEYRQVLLSARELNLDKIGGKENWINHTFIYTHGHGIVMSPVNVVTTEGQPEFFIKNIPPEITVNLKLDRPEIYFGESAGKDDYIVVKSSKEEFDYPLGETNQHTFYKEESGVDIGSFGRRVLFAWYFGKLNFLLNDYMQPTSKIIYTRNIKERIRNIAPYLRLDKDPYLVVENGRLYWICDAYTATDQFPYSKMSVEATRSPFSRDRTYNYVRNSVKITVDAYNGKTDFYSFNPENDPIIRVYSKIFPNVYKPISAMPDFLKKHLRYPQDLFDIQARLYAAYHMQDANVFFNKEDFWNIPQEKYGDAIQEMESYYMIMRLPGEKQNEFILMTPFTPNKKSNMISWMCARSDGENYGKLLVYKFPKTELVYGPMQVESRIDQTPEISEKLTLWNQQGSRVTRGNLLVVPINNSLLYIEPLYLQSEQSKLPELKKVIVAYDNYIYMEDNLEDGLEKIFGNVSAIKNETKTHKTLTEKNAKSDNEPSKTRDLARAAMKNYNDAQDALKKGDWTKYGEFLEKLKRDLERLNQIDK